MVPSVVASTVRPMVISPQDLSTPVRKSRAVVGTAVQVRFTDAQETLLRLVAAGSGEPIGAVVRCAVEAWAVAHVLPETGEHGGHPIDVDALIAAVEDAIEHAPAHDEDAEP